MTVKILIWYRKNMENIIICVILLAIVLGIIWYLVGAKSRGQKCIGCPYGKQCKGTCGEK